MSDLGSHDNDVAYRVLDIRQPLTIEATSPNVPVPQNERAPATMMVTYGFPASPSRAGPVRLIWHQGANTPPGWVPEWGGRSQLFTGDHGMLLGNGKLLPEEKFKDFQTPPETLPRSPGHRVEWVNCAKGLGPVPRSNFQYSGWPRPAPPAAESGASADANGAGARSAVFGTRKFLAPRACSTDTREAMALIAALAVAAIGLMKKSLGPPQTTNSAVAGSKPAHSTAFL